MRHATFAAMKALIQSLALLALFCAWHLATQTAARALPDEDLGSPLTHWRNEPVYVPGDWIEWSTRWPGRPELYRAQAIGVGATLAFLIILVLTRRRSTRAPVSTAHGAARFRTTAEVRAAGLGTRGVVLGQEDRARLDVLPQNDGPPKYRVRRTAPLIAARGYHSLIVGGSGSGKTAGPVKGTALSDRGRSVLFQDTSTRLFGDTAGWRSLHSYALNVTPTQMGGAGLNPMMSIRGGMDDIGDADAISVALVGSAEHAKAEGLVYWQAAEALITCTILHVLHHERRKSLPGVLDFLIKNPTVPPRRIVLGMHARAANSRIETRMEMLLRYSDGALSGAWTTAMNVLGFCADPRIADTLDRSDFRPEDMMQGDYPLSVYLTIPEDEMDRVPALCRLLANTMVRAVYRNIPEDVSSGELAAAGVINHEALIVLDEFTRPGVLPAFATGAADLRKHGGQLVFLIQGLAQLEATYGKNGAASILANCPVQVYFGINDEGTASLLNRMLGKRTVAQRRTGTSVSTRGGLFATSQSRSELDIEHGLDLVAIEELLRMPHDEALLRVPGAGWYNMKKLITHADPRFSERQNMKLLSAPEQLAHRHQAQS